LRATEKGDNRHFSRKTGTTAFFAQKRGQPLEATTQIELDGDKAPGRETYPLGGWRTVPVRLR
jgi:hypothetical protein